MTATTSNAYPSHESLAAIISRDGMTPDCSTPLPSYDADRPPPYFSRTPLEPWLATLRTPHWTHTDLHAFGAPPTAALRAELRAWGLPADPNGSVRTAAADPLGAPRDVRFVDGVFPAELAGTALSLRAPEASARMCNDAAFSPALLAAIAETAALGTYPQPHAVRPLAFTVGGAPYRGDWLLGCVPLPLGALLLPQADYARLAAALFLVQARHKWASDARARIEARRRNPLFRWRRARALAVVQEEGDDKGASAGWLPSSFSIASARESFGSLRNLASTATITAAS